MERPNFLARRLAQRVKESREKTARRDPLPFAKYRAKVIPIDDFKLQRDAEKEAARKRHPGFQEK